MHKKFEEEKEVHKYRGRWYICRIDMFIHNTRTHPKYRQLPLLLPRDFVRSINIIYLAFFLNLTFNILIYSVNLIVCKVNTCGSHYTLQNLLYIPQTKIIQ